MLSAGSGSSVDDVARATSVSVAAVASGGTVVCTVTVTTAPGAIVPTVQVRSGPTAQVPCDAAAVTPPMPPGSSSVTVTSFAGLGPSLRTVMVDVTT